MMNITAEVKKTISAPAAEVWQALTTPASLKSFFFGADVETDWKVGSAIRMHGEYQGRKYEDKGEVLTAEVQQQLSFSHWSAMSGQADVPENYHVITFTLEPVGDATTVILSQANLLGGVKPEDIEHRADYEKNWRAVLDGLEKLLR